MIGILDRTCVCIVISHLKKLFFLSDLSEFFFFLDVFQLYIMCMFFIVVGLIIFIKYVPSLSLKIKIE